MISISGLSKNFGSKVLFEKVTLQLNPGERYGLVGANGSGKTTFLKILTDDESSSDGVIMYGKQVRLGILRQDQFANDEERIVDVAMRGDKQVFAALQELDALAHDPDPSPEKLGDVNDLLHREEGYTLEARARETLEGLGIESALLDQPLRILSGGFKLRVLLAQVLVGRPDVLLLDEPTNHLDILSIRWLEKFLQNFAGCAVIISHDRRFLDSVSTRILDVDYATIIDYPGNYTAFLTRKDETRDRKEAEITKQEKLLAEKKAFVERFRAKATKARQAQSRAKQIDKIEIEELAPTSRRFPKFKFEQLRPSGRDVLKVEGLHKAYGDKQVLTGVGFEARRGERIAVIGANGMGKSTLLKIITGNLLHDSGSSEWGHEVRVGYFAQDHHELLNDPKLTPLNFLWDACPMEAVSYVRGQLGRMLFSGDEVDKPVTALSGGEAARVIFGKLAIQKPNVLVLDEPTNHLDLEAIEALTDSLKAYTGTLVFVSHDRHFVSQLATRIIEVKKDGLLNFNGTYDEYIEKAGDDHLDVSTVVLKAKKKPEAGDKPPTGIAVPEAKQTAKISAPEPKQKKPLNNRARELPKKRDRLLAEIEKLEAAKGAIGQTFAAPGFYEATSLEDQMKLGYRQANLDLQLEELMREWEGIETEIAALEGA